MATNNRQSLGTSLEDRYNSQTAGGAYDAKQAGTSTIPSGIQEVNFTNTKGFGVKPMVGVSEFKDVDGNKSKGLSMYAKGLDTTPYKK